MRYTIQMEIYTSRELFVKVTERELELSMIEKEMSCFMGITIWGREDSR